MTISEPEVLVPAPPPGTLRLMVWNLLNGGRDQGTYERLGNQATLISSYAPDVLCLPESTYWHQDDVALQMLEERTDLATALIARADGNHNVTLLYNSRRLSLVGEPSVRAKKAFHHTLVRAVLHPVDVPDERADFLVLGTHLDPCDPGRRLSEARWITDYAGSFPGFPPRAALLGDLNTPDRQPGSWDLVPRNLHSRYRQVDQEGRFGKVDQRSVRVLRASGWRDPHEVLGVERPPTVGYFYPDERAVWALDYALVAGLTPVQVHTHPFDTGFRLSDHLPHFVDVRLDA